ncbi:hypothetical protein [Actinoplanes sp. NPDC051851]|uniref:hypothetical protein n=1 Tax=Actinoplanes sp. NPDC051851 TaxID=3154753 RepID=UPI00343C0B2F
MRRSPLVILIAALALTGVAGCSDDETPPAAAPQSASPAPTESLDMPPTVDNPKPTDPITPGEQQASGFVAHLQISADGFGPYEIGATQEETIADGLIDSASDTGNGCATATGPGRYLSPALLFAQGKLVQIRVTAAQATTTDGVAPGAPLADVQAAYPAGKAVTGTGGVQGWETVGGTGALLVEVTGGTASALTAGVATTVEKVFTTGQGC